MNKVSTADKLIKSLENAWQKVLIFSAKLPEKIEFGWRAAPAYRMVNDEPVQYARRSVTEKNKKRPATIREAIEEADVFPRIYVDDKGKEALVLPFGKATPQAILKDLISGVTPEQRHKIDRQRHDEEFREASPFYGRESLQPRIPVYEFMPGDVITGPNARPTGKLEKHTLEIKVGDMRGQAQEAHK